MKESYPDEFCVSYKIKEMGYFFNLKWEDDHLTLKQFSNDHPGIQENITPTLNEWVDFWHRMDEIEIWDWYDEYLMTCLDACREGDEWEIGIVFGDMRMESHGANSYPSTFREFVKSLDELTDFLIEFIHQD
ncbi:MAG: hypothetical protein KO316_02575 [Methanobacterium sp.]|jgi:hypothetical protein|nr:hypothetical protein [Methanobacterium sp.]